jgi:hypothetical protein
MVHLQESRAIPLFRGVRSASGGTSMSYLGLPEPAHALIGVRRGYFTRSHFRQLQSRAPSKTPSSSTCMYCTETLGTLPF